MFQQCSKAKNLSNNNKIIYLYIRTSVVLVFAKSVWEIFFFTFWVKLWATLWDQGNHFFLPVGFFLGGFYAIWSLELTAFLPTF